MGIFDIFKKKDNLITIEDLKQESYKQKYFEQCKYIWKNYVPKRGQANVLQGELLRELEKLRCEAQDNGNINWDDDFSYFCDFIKETLCKQDVFDENEKTRVSIVLDYFKKCGDYAHDFNNGKIPSDSVEIDKVAYIKDDLYDIVADAIGLLQEKHPEPIPYVKNDKIRR